MTKLLLSLSLMIACGAYVSSSARADDLKVGDAAPDFKLEGSDGKTYDLKDLKGKTVVLAWFPKAHTKGCTAECKSMRENGKLLKAFDVAYFTASVDKPEDNKSFATDLGVDYPILSDPSKDVAKAYGVVHPGRDLAERWTFYIGPDGKIQYIDKTVKTETHGQDIAAKLKELGAKPKAG